MRITINQFLSKGVVSWAIVGQSIGRSLIKLGHEVDFLSTDGVDEKFFPNDLKPYAKQAPEGKYDAAISYTAMHNFPRYLSHAPKNRLGIWNFDGTIVPPDMVKFHNFCDNLCPSSKFASDTFIKSGVPEEKVVTIPHGIDLSEFKTDKKFKLNTKKSKKILLNIASPHKRKNLVNTLKAYGEAFSKKDDVCLVVKVNNKHKKDNKFFVDFNKVLSKFKKKYRNHAEIEVVEGFVPSLAELYNACDIVFMMSHLECFWMVGLEGLAAGKLVVASNHGGQLQYLNTSNSLLIDGKIGRMPRNFQYWQTSAHNEMFEPDLGHAVQQLRKAVSEYDDLVNNFGSEIKKTAEDHSWDIIAEKFLSLTNV